MHVHVRTMVYVITLFDAHFNYHRHFTEKNKLNTLWLNVVLTHASKFGFIIFLNSVV
jgi:hypothetical protein